MFLFQEIREFIHIIGFDVDSAVMWHGLLIGCEKVDCQLDFRGESLHSWQVIA